MGYLMSAFAIEIPPPEGALRAALPGHGFRAYTVEGGAGALVHVWRCPGKPGYFFCDTPRDRFDASIPVPARWSAAFGRLAQAFEWLSRDQRLYGLGWTQLAVGLAAAVGREVFFFASDDDLYDCAVRVAPDGTLRFGAGFGAVEIAFDGARCSVTRVIDIDEDAASVPPLSRLPEDWYAVTEPRLSDGGKMLHETPIRMWPAWAPTSADIGLGGDIPDERDGSLHLVTDGACP
jgi:hypothetical protein